MSSEQSGALMKLEHFSAKPYAKDVKGSQELYEAQLGHQGAHNGDMAGTPSDLSTPRRAAKGSRLALWSAFVVFGSSGAWFIPHALIPRGFGYTYDPVANVQSGPWVPWTYVVCGVALLAIAVVASWHRYWPTALLLAPVLIWAWSFTASREDDSGLWLVGLIFMTIYTVAGTLAVLGTTRFARSLSDQRKSAAARRSRLPPLTR